MPIRLRLTIGILASLILAGSIGNFSLAQGFDYGLYVTEIAVALTVILISVLFWTFKPYLEKAGINISDYDKQVDEKLDEKKRHEAKEHRKTINDEFIKRRIQISLVAFTWLEILQAFADAKQFLQHICTGHPELYQKMHNLIDIEKQIKNLPIPHTTESITELRKQENQLREQVRTEFDNLQTKIRQQTDDLGGICDNCIKFHNKRTKTFKEMKVRLDSFTMPF